jgi:hypothetical protein
MTNLLKLILGDSLCHRLGFHRHSRASDCLQRHEFPAVDRLPIILLEAVEEKPTVLEIASDNSPSATALPRPGTGMRFLNTLSAQVSVNQTPRHLLYCCTQHLIADTRLAAAAPKGLGLEHPPHGSCISLGDID